MIGFTPLFESIIASTIWSEDSDTRVVWVTMLALKNKYHIVEGSVPGLARLAGVSPEKTRKALEKFKSPDKESRSQANGGRRIKDVPGGWLILNGELYQEKLMEMRQRERWSRAQKAARERRQTKNPTPSAEAAYVRADGEEAQDRVLEQEEEARRIRRRVGK